MVGTLGRRCNWTESPLCSFVWRLGTSHAKAWAGWLRADPGRYPGPSCIRSHRGAAPAPLGPLGPSGPGPRPALAPHNRGGPLGGAALPRLWVQARRLLVLANMALGPEPLALGSLRGMGRLGLAGVGAALAGVPTIHYHPSAPSPLLVEPVGGGVVRLARVLRAAVRAEVRVRVRPPLGRGRTAPGSVGPRRAPTFEQVGGAWDLERVVNQTWGCVWGALNPDKVTRRMGPIRAPTAPARSGAPWPNPGGRPFGAPGQTIAGCEVPDLGFVRPRSLPNGGGADYQFEAWARAKLESRPAAGFKGWRGGRGRKGVARGRRLEPARGEVANLGPDGPGGAHSSSWGGRRVPYARGGLGGRLRALSGHLFGNPQPGAQTPLDGAAATVLPGLRPSLGGRHGAHRLWELAPRGAPGDRRRALRLVKEAADKARKGRGRARPPEPVNHGHPEPATPPAQGGVGPEAAEAHLVGRLFKAPRPRGPLNKGLPTPAADAGGGPLTALRPPKYLGPRPLADVALAEYHTAGRGRLTLRSAAARHTPHGSLPAPLCGPHTTPPLGPSKATAAHFLGHVTQGAPAPVGGSGPLGPRAAEILLPARRGCVAPWLEPPGAGHQPMPGWLRAPTPARLLPRSGSFFPLRGRLWVRRGTRGGPHDGALLPLPTAARRGGALEYRAYYGPRPGGRGGGPAWAWGRGRGAAYRRKEAMRVEGLVELGPGAGRGLGCHVPFRTPAA